MLLKISVFALLALFAVNVRAVDKARLRFKLSATGLPDKDTGFNTIDPYVEVFYTELGSTSATKIGRTATINNNQNPEWSNVFEFDFDRSKNQKWNFKIWDHDVAGEDDKGGRAWVDVNDYVDKGEVTNVRLDKQGYLTVRSANPQQALFGGLNNPGQLPLPAGTPDTLNLKFKLSANGLSSKDDVGFIQGSSDPYAEIFLADGITGKATKIGRTGTLHDTKDPSWGESFQVQFDRRKDQRLQVRIWDNDNFREDDKAGLVWIELNDYVAHGQHLTANLNKKGSVTVTRADGLPINPYTPGTTPGSSHQNHPPAGFVQPGVNQPAVQPIQKGTVPVVTPPTANRPQVPAPQNVAAAAQPTTLRFTLSANNLPDKDLIGTSDPYVKVFLTQDGRAEELLKTSSKKNDDENPVWPDVFDFKYDPSKHPRIRFLVLDEDDNRRDDELGDVSIEASDLFDRRFVSASLPKGTLSIQRV